MNPTDFLANLGARHNFCDLGDPESELRNARSATILVPLVDMGVIEISGDDATSFAHNLLTNDINKLAPDDACHAGFCTAKGRLLASLLAWRSDTGLRLVLPTDLLASIQKKLSMYVLRAKALVQDISPRVVLLGLSGPDAANALAAIGVGPLGVLKLGQFDDGTVIRLGGERYLLALTAEAAASVWQKLAGLAQPAGLDAWHWLEILAGMPRITAATQEAFVPQMVNFELLGGVSFTKGCYPGQEIVARSHYLGKVKRRMFRASVQGEVTGAVSGASLFCPQTAEQSCGTIVQAAPSPMGGKELLAVIQTDCFEAGDVHLASLSGPILRFLPLPYALESSSPASPVDPAT